jgi:small subunit ribosomal protein S12
MRSKPQRKGVIFRVYTTNPKKPNSAQRKVCKVKLTDSKYMLCAIKNVKHNLKKFSKI